MKNVVILLAVLCIFAPISFGTTCFENSSDTVSYTVRRGDWLSKIAIAAYSPNVRLDSEFTEENMMEKVEFLLAHNPEITDRDKIYVGQVLQIPCPRVKKTPRQFAPKVQSEVLNHLEQISVLEVEIPVLETSVESNVIALSFTELILNPPPMPLEIPQQTVKETLVIDSVPIPLKANNKGKSYQVIIHVPEGAITGINEGDFPAVLAERQRKDGRWNSRTDTSVSVKKVLTTYDVYFTAKKKPDIDSILRVNFKNGAEFSFEGKHLVLGDLSKEKVPKKLKGKGDYKTLHVALPKKPGLFAKLIRPIIPLGPLVGMALLGNPLPLIYSAVGMTSNKIASKDANTLKSQTDADQEARIQMLEAQVNALAEYITLLEQNGNSNQLAQNAQ